MKVKTSGIQVKIMACAGSGGVGFHAHLQENIVMPMMIGQTPRCTMVGASMGSSEQVDDRVGSGADRSLIQPKNGPGAFRS